jgi:hypothetical protein
VNCVETVLELSGTDVAFSELLATQPESLPSQAGDTAEMAPKIDFSACYARELSSLVWFVMSLGADAHRAADVAPSAFAEAFAVWDRTRLTWSPWPPGHAGSGPACGPAGPGLACQHAAGLGFAERVRMRNVRIRTRRVCRLHFEPAQHVELRR